LIPLQDTHPRSAQAEYDHAHELFLHGYLEKSQLEAAHGYGRLLRSDLEWASRFQLLEARAMVARGMNEDALQLLSALPPIIHTREGIIEKLTLEGVAFTSLHQFDFANQRLTEAQNLCRATFYTACDGVPLRRGLLAIQRGQLVEARWLFLESLSITRAEHDRWMETTALLNIGFASLQDEHYDEAVDWLTSAYRAAVALDAEDLALMVSGNLGWAYLELGDTERALGLFLEAEKHAIDLGDLRAQLTWLKAAGNVYRDDGKLIQAKETFRQALDLATQVKSKEDIIDTLEDLAHVSVETGDLAAASAYIDRVAPLARASGNNLDISYVSLAQGKLAAARHQDAQAEGLFRAVEQNPASQVSMRFGAEHELARLFEQQGSVAAAQAMYRTALATFEGARDQLKDDDSKLPFLANAKSIYDDYIHFRVTQGKTEEALVTADQSRARTLAQGFGQASDQRVLSPAALPPQAVARKAGATLLFYWLGEKQSYLWAITPEKTTLFTLPAQREITPLIERYRKVLLGTQDPLESGNTTGQQLYSMLVAPAAKLLQPGVPVMVLTDGALSQLNFETLIVPGAASGEDTAKSASGQPHYWIEDATLAAAPSLAMLAAAKPVRETNRNLLLLGDAVSPGEDYPELPFASTEMQQIEKHFAAHDEVVFARGQATPSAYLSSDPAHFSYIHFVSHGVASRTDPLDSAIILSRAGTPAASANGTAEDSFKLYAREVMRHPIDARLVTISACYGSGTRTYAGEGLVGLSWAFLRAGAHNVVGALWEADDESSPQLMDSMYQGLQEGKRPDEALRGAKLALLHSTNKFRKAYYWAPFQIYTRL
jgi:CHAT domain-containing protein/tetratricopeptide (TPR) repeat protein